MYEEKTREVRNRAAFCEDKRSVPAKICSLLLFWATCARAVELQLQFGALERMLAEQVFTQEGRRYVRGDARNKCNFAYLEKPRIEGKAGWMLIHARFSGRTSMNLFGACVGLGDAFDLTITTMPEYRDGNIRLTKVSVAADKGRTGYYIRRVCTIMAASLERDFRYPLAVEAKRILEDTTNQPQYKREMRNLTVPAVRVAGDALVLVLDFQLAVK